MLGSRSQKKEIRRGWEKLLAINGIAWLFNDCSLSDDMKEEAKCAHIEFLRISEMHSEK
jgi:hypothetical protein